MAKFPTLGERIELSKSKEEWLRDLITNFLEEAHTTMPNQTAQVYGNYILLSLYNAAKFKRKEKTELAELTIGKP